MQSHNLHEWCCFASWSISNIFEQEIEFQYAASKFYAFSLVANVCMQVYL